MPAYPRREIVAQGEVGVYHCVARCVRRAFLCGVDAVSGRDYEHRKGWIERRLVQLAEVFAIEVCGFAVMSNHLHLVVRTRPDEAGGLSDEEVASRWWRLFPKRRDEDGQAAEPEPHELAAALADEEWLAERRTRLADLSWFMRCLCEPIARRANREDDCTGRFWEGRFKSQALLDEAAVLACTMYVDLNPIRAGVAESPETSQHTSGFSRIHARQARRSRPQSPAAADDAWLCPIEPESAADHAQHGQSQASRRKSFLQMRLDDYLRLLDWTGRQLHIGKCGRIPEHLAPILDRLSVSADNWLLCVTHFGRWFRRAAGRVEHLAAKAAACGRCWLVGQEKSRIAFG